MGITRIPLLDPRRRTLQPCDGDPLEVVRRVQGWHKREIDFVPRREIARGLAGRGELAAFEVTKMPDVVRRLIPACAGEGRLPWRRQQAVSHPPDLVVDGASHRVRAAHALISR
jgi:hypothetical protein